VDPWESPNTTHLLQPEHPTNIINLLFGPNGPRRFAPHKLWESETNRIIIIELPKWVVLSGATNGKGLGVTKYFIRFKLLSFWDDVYRITIWWFSTIVVFISTKYLFHYTSRIMNIHLLVTKQHFSKKIIILNIFIVIDEVFILFWMTATFLIS